MARRSNHEGSIYQRADGQWVASIQVAGRRLYKYGKSRSEAHQKLQAILREHHQGTITHPTRITLRTWVEQWLAGERLRASTRHTYEHVLRRVLDEVGMLTLPKLTPLVLSLTLTKLAQQGMGARRVQMAYIYLKRCLQKAVELNLLGSNPLARVKRPKVEAKPRQYWTVEEASRFIATCRVSHLKFAPFFGLLVTTGLRVSEALALTSSDIDFAAGVLHVERALVWSANTYVVERTKSKSGRRTVSLTRDSVLFLQQVMSQQEEDGRLFQTASGEPISPKQQGRSLRALCKAAGVPQIHCHSLRHTQASLAYLATGDMLAVAARLGHSSVTVTMGIYAHLLRSDASTAAALDNLLNGKAEEGAEENTRG